MSEYYNGKDLVEKEHGEFTLIVGKRNAGKLAYFMEHPNSSMLDFYPDIRGAIRATIDLSAKRENNKE